MGRETITLIYPADARLDLPTRNPCTDEEKLNYRKLVDTGAEILLTDLSKSHFLNQSIVTGFDTKNNKVVKIEPAVVMLSKDFRSAMIFFDGATSVKCEDGSFIKLGLCESDDQLSLTSRIGNNFKISRLIDVVDLEEEIYQVLITRELSRGFESRK